MGWYQGPTVLQAMLIDTQPLNAPELPIKSFGAPTRFVVQRIYPRLSGKRPHELIVGGCILSGSLAVDDRLEVQPSGASDVVIKSIEAHHRPRRRVVGPYESVVLKLEWLSPASIPSGDAQGSLTLHLSHVIARGSVVANQEKEASNQLKRVTKAQGNMIVMSHPGQIRSGYSPTVRVHSADVRCSIKLCSRVHSFISIRPSLI